MNYCVEGDDILGRSRDVGDDEADARIKCTRMPFNLGRSPGTAFEPGSRHYRQINGRPRLSVGGTAIGFAKGAAAGPLQKLPLALQTTPAWSVQWGSVPADDWTKPPPYHANRCLGIFGGWAGELRLRPSTIYFISY
jgi:hypothetical protein